MRFSTLVIGAAIGVAIYYWYQNAQMALLEVDGKARFTKEPEPKHAVQEDDAHIRVTELIDEVVHEKDVPDTAVKAAFEQAIASEK